MSSLSEVELDNLRKVVADPINSCYRSLLRDSTLDVIDNMIRDVDFPGATDPWGLSFLGFMARILQPARVLELGTRIGFSTIVLADIVSSNHTLGRVTTVDPWVPHVEKAKKYVQDAGLTGAVEFVAGRSVDASVIEDLERRGPFDLIYIDSSHFYEETMQELETYTAAKLTHMKSILLLHDVSEAARSMDTTGRGGVSQALHDWYERRKREYQLFVLEPPFWPNPAGLAMISHRLIFE